MPSHLVRVKSRLFVRSRRRVLHAADGEYASRSRGRGIDLDDLRDYQPGDDVRDIDWKATARRAEPLVRRYHPTRQRSVVVLADTGSSMAAVTPALEVKADLAVHAAGVLGYLAVRHGDRVGLVLGDRSGVEVVPPRDGERHLDRLLGRAHHAMTARAAGPDLLAVIDRGLDVLRKGAIAVVVTDDVALSPALEERVRRLARRHDTLWIGVADANPARVLARTGVGDAVSRRHLPGHLRRARRLAEEHDALAARLRTGLTTVLDEAGVSHCRVETQDDALRELLGMLRRRPYGR